MADAPWRLDEVVPYTVVRTAHALQHYFASLIAAEGLTSRHFGILSQFARDEVLTAAQIARALEVTPQSIGPQIEALQSRGLITRRPRPGRGRPNELRLTAEGTAMLRRALVIARDAQERIVGHMSAPERATMLAQLHEMRARARELDGG